MSAASLYRYFVAQADGAYYRLGSLSSPVTLTADDDLIVEKVVEVAASSSEKLFDVTEDSSDFQQLWIETDQDVLLQMTADAGGASENFFVLKLPGTGTTGSYGPPFILASNYAQKADGTVDQFDGTADTIDEIWAYNQSASDTARVRVFVRT